MAVRIVDTDVYSYLHQQNPAMGLLYKPHLDGHTITLSFITVGEQYAGYEKQIVRKNWDVARLAELEVRFRSVVIIPYDIEVCRTFGNLKATLEIAGRSVAPNDLWIAACAKRHALTLVTNNRKHFDGIPGLNIISEAPN
jgi:tRNA(fMet)-specific endonuclease VapC